MSERTRSSQPSGAHHEALDLPDPHALNAKGSLRQETTESANTDLTSASIQSISVVRLTAQPGKRKLSSLNLSTVPALDETREDNPKVRPQHSRRENHGILKNPYFSYRGGPLERFITLVANLLKYLERSLLASLQPQAPQPPHVITPMKRKDALGREVNEDEYTRREGQNPPSRSSHDKPTSESQL
ncbi:MAG: hypothetical protein RIS36_659 [Pseudomonadota bacterium]|jgi:hypothetical protein